MRINLLLLSHRDILDVSFECVKAFLNRDIEFIARCLDLTRATILYTVCYWGLMLGFRYRYRSRTGTVPGGLPQPSARLGSADATFSVQSSGPARQGQTYEAKGKSNPKAVLVNGLTTNVRPKVYHFDFVSFIV